jgi:valyl-tRNA synthetase
MGALEIGDRMTKAALPTTYDFKSIEERIYKLWEESGYFKPINDPKKPDHDSQLKPYVISIPPPNVTGKLHLGHAMFVSMEDLMIRYHRMLGIPTLWVPGTDHAGIATQLQVERALKAEGTSREEIGREAFLQRTWAWKDEFGGHITRQIRRLGASCDWSRERFTLDEGLSRAVREAFVRLYEKGFIYRGPRLINWSPGLKTAVSDLEVEYHEESGKLYYFKYQIARGSDADFIPVATTRPETILGDTAVAVHPDDARYQQFIGRKAIVPILGREIPVIADRYVDIEFGTGALKITPGHDPNDFEIGERHGLDIISVLDESVRVNANGGPYQGQDRFECRQNLWNDMKAAGLVIKEETYIHQVPRSQRGGEIIEPMVSTQWFVKMESLAAAALKAVQDGNIKIIPERFEKVYFNWLENIQDWCISRQLWWGHRIPVWYCSDCSEMIVSHQVPTECAACGSTNIYQDPDVLDTWFSSALWPFSTLGWPDPNPDLDYFYPTTMMETGYDILFFWVARMIMSGLEFTSQVPFSQIYLHGLIRDEHGKKMSKSYGNVIDPLEVMDEMGTDALRFTLLVGSTPGNDMNLSLKKVEANRNFANKLWNAARLVISSIPLTPLAPQAAPEWTLADRFIWARTMAVIRDVKRLFDSYQYGEAGRQVYDFFWSEYADWYLEIAKLQLQEGADRAFYTLECLLGVLDIILRLLHPFTPFITEELFSHLKAAAQAHSPHLLPQDGSWPEALIIASWPSVSDPQGWEESAIKDFTLFQEIIRTIRNLRAEKNIKPAQKIPAIIVAGPFTSTLSRLSTSLASLARLDPQQLLLVETLDQKPEDHIALIAGSAEIYLPLANIINIEEEQTRLKTELAEVQLQVDRLQELLAGPFSEKAPQPVVQKERDRLMSFQDIALKLQTQLQELSQEP